MYNYQSQIFTSSLFSTFSIFPFFLFFFFLGFGQPDVFYPKNLLGSWNVAQTYTDITGENKNLYITEILSKKMLSQKSEKVEGKVVEKGEGRGGEKEGSEQGREGGSKEVEKKGEISPITIQYQCNFIDIKGNIVRDRSYCETNKFNALLSSQEKEVEKEVEKGGRISALGTWDYSNPNILSTQLSNGMVRNILIFVSYVYYSLFVLLFLFLLSLTFIFIQILILVHCLLPYSYFHSDSYSHCCSYILILISYFFLLRILYSFFSTSFIYKCFLFLCNLIY